MNANNTKAKGTKAATAKGTKAKGEADKAKACTFPRALVVDAVKADGDAEKAGLALLRGGIANKLAVALYMDVSREVGRAVPLATAKVRVSEVNAAHAVGAVYDAKLADAIIATGGKLPGHKVRNGLAALRVAKDAAKDAGDTFPKAHGARLAFFNAAWKAELARLEALKASRAKALAAGKGTSAGDGDGDKATGAEGNKFPDAKVTNLDDARARIETHRATLQAIHRDMAALPAAAFASKAARVAAIEGLDTMVDLITDCLAKPAG
jgi:hypothetical protein